MTEDEILAALMRRILTERVFSRGGNHYVHLADDAYYAPDDGSDEDHFDLTLTLDSTWVLSRAEYDLLEGLDEFENAHYLCVCESDKCGLVREGEHHCARCVDLRCPVEPWACQPWQRSPDERDTQMDRAGE